MRCKRRSINTVRNDLEFFLTPRPRDCLALLGFAGDLRPFSRGQPAEAKVQHVFHQLLARHEEHFLGSVEAISPEFLEGMKSGSEKFLAASLQKC